MGRGLGTTQRMILEVIENGEANIRHRIKSNRHIGDHVGWTDVELLTDYVVNGHHCWLKRDYSNRDRDYYDPGFRFKEPTISDKQRIWRAVRTLEARGIIESKVIPISYEERYDRPDHLNTDKKYTLKKGGANKQKLIRLVQ